MTKAKSITPTTPSLAWELDARGTRFIFEAAREKAAESIQRLRNELITLEHYDPIPQTSRNGNPEMYDQKKKAEIVADKQEWIKYYEGIHRFCLRVDERIGNIEAERFADQMADFFKARKGGE